MKLVLNILCLLFVISTNLAHGSNIEPIFKGEYKNKLDRIWNKIRDSKHTVVIIGGQMATPDDQKHIATGLFREEFPQGQYISYPLIQEQTEIPFAQFNKKINFNYAYLEFLIQSKKIDYVVSQNIDGVFKSYREAFSEDNTDEVGHIFDLDNKKKVVLNLDVLNGEVLKNIDVTDLCVFLGNNLKDKNIGLLYQECRKKKADIIVIGQIETPFEKEIDFKDRLYNSPKDFFTYLKNNCLELPEYYLSVMTDLNNKSEGFIQLYDFRMDGIDDQSSSFKGISDELRVAGIKKTNFVLYKMAPGEYVIKSTK